jgi:hypothetical protein
MAYIGKQPVVGNFQVCDAISVVNGQAAYTMQVASANVEPENANHMLVSLNGVLQKPGSSFTISGSTITFASNLVTGDVIDFIQILGNVLDLGVPSDSTVSLAKLTATGTKSSSTFLRGDNTFNTPPLGGITEADMHRLTTDFTGNVSPIANNWERVDDASFAKIGTGITNNSGTWSFGATGLYQLIFHTSFNHGSSDIRYIYNHLNVTVNNSSYVEIATGWTNLKLIGSTTYTSAELSTFINVDNVSNVKFKLGSNSDSGAAVTMGTTANSYTWVQTIRLGDAQ